MNHPKNPIENFLYGKPGKASNYVHHLQASELDKKKIYGMFCRVSSRQQKKNENLKNQDLTIITEFKYRNGELHKVKFLIEYSGKMGKGYREVLKRIGDECRKHGITDLVATTSDRFLRADKFQSNDKNKWKVIPTNDNWEDFKHSLGNGINCHTILHPDASPSESRSFMTKLGLDRKGSRSAKTKKYIGKEMKPIAKKLKSDNPNWSIRRIAKEMNQPLTSVRRWLEE